LFARRSNPANGGIEAGCSLQSGLDIFHPEGHMLNPLVGSLHLIAGTSFSPPYVNFIIFVA